MVRVIPYRLEKLFLVHIFWFFIERSRIANTANVRFVFMFSRKDEYVAENRAK